MRRLAAAPQASTAEAAAVVPKKRGRPSLPDLILRAVCLATARKGASLVAIKKALLAGGYDVQKNSGRLKAALSSLVTKGLLQRVTGSGVAGSFKLSKHPKKGSASQTAKKRTAVKRPKPQIAARRSPKKMSLPLARTAKGPKLAVKRPKAHRDPAKPKRRAATRGKAAVKKH
ncbi:histone H1.5-like [Carettochelys insculpta]|uniref:histone H1.5-like n=1 Tax=Carettochelys insculpta TaxID=44489 RepID=UPI003EC0F144